MPSWVLFNRDFIKTTRLSLAVGGIGLKRRGRLFYFLLSNRDLIIQFRGTSYFIKTFPGDKTNKKAYIYSALLLFTLTGVRQFEPLLVFTVFSGSTKRTSSFSLSFGICLVALYFQGLLKELICAFG